MKTVKVTAIEDSPVLFMGHPSYKKGDTMVGVLDITTETALVNFRWGNQFIEMSDKNFAMTIEDSVAKSESIQNINTYLKTLSLEKWVKDTVENKYEIVILYPEKNMQLANNVRGNGGTEYITTSLNLLAIRNIEKDTDYITQIRKGSMFYINKNLNGFKTQALELEALSYEVLKEIKYIIDNDYKYGGGK